MSSGSDDTLCMVWWRIEMIGPGLRSGLATIRSFLRGNRPLKVDTQFHGFVLGHANDKKPA